jgi:hypothetical protein
MNGGVEFSSVVVVGQRSYDSLSSQHGRDPKAN